MLKKILIGLLAVVAVLVLVSFLLPSSYHVARSTTMAAAPQAIFDEINGFRNWQSWSPWQKYDPSNVNTKSGADTGVGAVLGWKSDKLGNGAMTITESTPPSHVGIDIMFEGQGEGKVSYDISPTDNQQTAVTWSMDGDLGYNPIMRWMGFVMMDKWLGKDFESGLANLKDFMEKNAAAATTTPPPATATTDTTKTN